MLAENQVRGPMVLRRNDVRIALSAALDLPVNSQQWVHPSSVEDEAEGCASRCGNSIKLS